LTTTFAQSTTYQFIYYKTGTDAKPIYYFSDLFTSTDWYNSKEDIKSKFKSLLAEEGVDTNALLIQEGLKGEIQLIQNLRPMDLKRYLSNRIKTISNEYKVNIQQTKSRSLIPPKRQLT